MPQVMYRFLLITSIILIVSGLFLTAFSIFSPLWEVVDFPRTHLSHHHGLWWDCVVHHDTLIPLREFQAELRVDRCESKMDASVQASLRVALERGDAEARELLLHRFLPHHKGVLFFAVFTFVFGLISLIIGSCSPCFPPNALLYVVGVFMTCACSVLADIIFVIAFNQKQMALPIFDQNNEPIRREKGDIGPIFKRLGFATYIHMLGSILFVGAFVFSIFCAYFLITSKHAHDVCCTSRKEYRDQTNSRWRNSGLILKTGGRSLQASRPFVVIDDDSSI